MSDARRMRVTFFLVSLGGSGGVRVGIRMANELAQRGHEVRLAVPRPPTRRLLRDLLRRPFTWKGTVRVPTVRFRRAADVPLREGELAVAVGSQLARAVSELRGGVGKLLWCHGLIENQPEEMRAAFSLPVPKVAVSPTLLDPLRAYGGGEVLGVVPNGIDPAEYHLDERAPRDGVGLIYREHWTKDPELARAALAELRTRMPGVPLRAFGFGPDPGLPGVEYVRSPSIAEARALYNRSLVWVVTSRSEGFCLPILEAMACGAAVVTTAHRSAPGLVDDGRNGRIVPLGEVAPLVDAVQELVTDDARRRAFVQAGFATATEYTWPRAAEAMEGCLASLSRTVEERR